MMEETGTESDGEEIRGKERQSMKLMEGEPLAYLE